ncbi:hypothetical protein C451_05835 [Halococcus thailandensis JCM 13552]|uniref:Uncharacterized protein n=1 Tax=Halococcus thailandensis JCM 13552 TaxID=1227457 RepID=M0ND62_9EURY|nr:hypothetical protein C451_05835 [Halococcus thailandensis JCM 13552]
MTAVGLLGPSLTNIQFLRRPLQHDFRVDIDRCVQPHFALFGQLNLFFVNRNAIRFGGECLLVRLGERLTPVANSGAAAVNAEPAEHVADFGK